VGVVGGEVDLPLASVIEELRSELATAVMAGKNSDVRFVLGPIDLELEVAISHEAGGEAGLKIHVVTLGGKASRTSATTHTLRLNLTPVSESGTFTIGSVQEQRPR
jgi:hypothetical protein